MEYRYVEHLWFVYALFGIFLLNLLLSENAKELPIIICWLTLFSIVHHYFDIPFIIWKIVKHMPDFIYGRWCFKYLDKSKKENISKNRICGIFACIISMLFITEYVENYDSSIYSLISTYSNYILRICIALSIYFIARNIQENIEKMLTTVGEYSYDIYFMHTPYIVPVLVMALSRLEVPTSLEILLSVCCGIMIPILVSKFVLRRFVLCKRIMLGMEK